MYLVDADGHVEESEKTFSDAYFDPGFRAERPRVVAIDQMVYWMIQEQMYPRRVGHGCHNLGTPASYKGEKTPHAKKKSDSIASMEIHGVGERLGAMDREGIALRNCPTSSLSNAFSRVSAQCESSTSHGHEQRVQPFSRRSSR